MIKLPKNTGLRLAPELNIKLNLICRSQIHFLLISADFKKNLLIHSVNLWGYKNKRRTNSSNIDLNRNFETYITAFSSENTSYTKINKFLNPPGSYQHTVFHLYP